MTCNPGRHVYLEHRDGSDGWEPASFCAFCGAARPKRAHRIAWDAVAVGLCFIAFVAWLGFAIPWLAAGWRMR